MLSYIDVIHIKKERVREREKERERERSSEIDYSRIEIC